MKTVLKLAFYIGLAAFSGMVSAFDRGKDVENSIRPCLEKIKAVDHFFYDNLLKEDELKKCYEDAKLFDKYHNKTLSEFSLWLGVYATVEKLNGELVNLVSLGEEKGTNSHKNIPDNYDGIPTIWADELMYNYELNEKLGDELFKNKEIVVVGAVRGISLDNASKEAVIELEADSLGLLSVFVQLDKSSLKKAKEIDRGQIIAVAAKVKGGDRNRVDLSHGKVKAINL